MIKIDDLEFGYANSNFKLCIPKLVVNKEEKIAVIGPSGSGKTSLLKLLSGILIPDKGLVELDGVCINQLSDANRRNFRVNHIGFIFQDFELMDYLSVSDNILHPFRISNALKLNKSVMLRATQLAEELGIGYKIKHYPGTLSQGEKQRTAICRAMITSPQLILADEATGNLDPANKHKIIDALFSSVEASKAMLVAVTHDHEVLDRFDRVIDFKDYFQYQVNPDKHIARNRG